MGKRTRARFREAAEPQIYEYRVPGRLLEARDNTADGRRVFRVQIIESGDSINGSRYPLPVLTKAVPLYEGAKAFDHHRSDAERRASGISGLVGEYRNVEANGTGLEADLVLLPGATHTAEALDASLEAQSQGRRPLVGISHDAVGYARNVFERGRRFREATEILQVHSADVVADPSAGGRPLRMVAGGESQFEPITEGTEMDLKQLLALLRDADDTKRAELLTEHKAILDDYGLDNAAVDRLLTVPAEAPATTTPAATPPETTPEPKKELATVGAPAPVQEASYAKTSILGDHLIEAAVKRAKLPEKAAEVVRGQLAERFTEADVTGAIGMAQSMLTSIERAELRPLIESVTVGADERDKMVEGLDKFFAGDFSVFRSFKESIYAFTGINPYDPKHRGEDPNRLLLRECIGDATYSSENRFTESATTATFAHALGDSITRRMVAEYRLPGLNNFQALVSSMPPINDFRTQRIDRIGGYGVLPTVAEGAPYQPLTTPGDEEATYAISKKGGTEDVTLEMIANDDVRLISRIPQRLGRSAIRTLHDAVWDVLATNPTCSYDSVALFAAGHSNTTAAALSNSSITTLATKFKRQTGYGDTREILNLDWAALVVPPELMELGNEIVSSTYAVPATTPGATNVANMWSGRQLIVEPYLSDTNDWFLIANGADVPLIEVGFYLGRQDPELFTQVDPTVGSVFNADKQTWKIRHIWGLTVLDHRGMQRATQ